MLPVLRCGVVFGIPVVGSCGSRKVQGPAVGGRDHFYCVWVADVFGSAEDFEGGDFDMGFCEGFEECGEMFGFEERFVTLDVDVDIGRDQLGDGVNAVSAAGEVG